ncbi:hypothetical protein QYM36_004995 [Artemia franciscana]|uniref:Uncharacterized protein n=1 Tax=Artemia franciscana TaxID=6661 RepID=A0AA88ICI1_ARTSF|nr:hypothetical protein QYM36_004995 [Artemia franciscana]
MSGVFEISKQTEKRQREMVEKKHRVEEKDEAKKKRHKEKSEVARDLNATLQAVLELESKKFNALQKL